MILSLLKPAGEICSLTPREHTQVQLNPQEIRYLKDLSPKYKHVKKAHCVHSICACFDAMRLKLQHCIREPISFLAPGIAPSQGKDLPLLLKQVIVFTKEMSNPSPPATCLLGSCDFNGAFSIKGFFTPSVIFLKDTEISSYLPCFRFTWERAVIL